MVDLPGPEAVPEESASLEELRHPDVSSATAPAAIVALATFKPRMSVPFFGWREVVFVRWE
jgi:hypothetical protein